MNNYKLIVILNYFAQCNNFPRLVDSRLLLFSHFLFSNDPSFISNSSPFNLPFRQTAPVLCQTLLLNRHTTAHKGILMTKSTRMYKIVGMYESTIGENTMDDFWLVGEHKNLAIKSKGEQVNLIPSITGLKRKTLISYSYQLSRFQKKFWI